MNCYYISYAFHFEEYLFISRTKHSVIVAILTFCRPFSEFDGPTVSTPEWKNNEKI